MRLYELLEVVDDDTRIELDGHIRYAGKKNEIDAQTLFLDKKVTAIVPEHNSKENILYVEIGD